MYNFSRCQRMDDLVTAFLDALQERHSEGRLTETAYQNVMRNLRYQLVEFVFTCITSDVTPRLEVTVRLILFYFISFLFYFFWSSKYFQSACLFIVNCNMKF